MKFIEAKLISGRIFIVKVIAKRLYHRLPIGRLRALVPLVPGTMPPTTGAISIFSGDHMATLGAHEGWLT